MPYVSTPVRRVVEEQTLSTSYGAVITVPVGARSASVTLSDSAIAFVVQDQRSGTPEEAIPAGSSWTIGIDDPLAVKIELKIKSASGTPVASVAYFLPALVS